MRHGWAALLHDMLYFVCPPASAATRPQASMLCWRQISVCMQHAACTAHQRDSRQLAKPCVAGAPCRATTLRNVSDTLLARATTLPSTSSAFLWGM
jgi:hypothetical protein